MEIAYTAAFNDQSCVNQYLCITSLSFIFLLHHVDNRWGLALCTWDKYKAKEILKIFCQHAVTTETHIYFNTLFFAGWLWRVCGSLGVGQLHPLDVLFADHFMLYYRMWVVFTHNAACRLLDAAWSFPGLIDVLSWELLEKRKVLPANTAKEKVLKWGTG